MKICEIGDLFEVGDCITLKVIFNVKYRRLEFEHIGMRMDPFVSNTPSLRVFQPNGSINLRQGEIWQGIVKEIKVGRVITQNSGRKIIYINLINFIRITKFVKKLIDDTGYIETWSGNRLIDNGKSKPIEMKVTKEEYFYGFGPELDRVRIITFYSGPDGELFGQTDEIESKTDFEAKLRKAKIDVNKYMAQLEPYNKITSNAS